MTTRRKAMNGEGSVDFKILKDGSKSWWARCPKDPKRPTERGEYKAGFRTQAEAVAWRRKRTAEIMAGNGLNDKALTVPQVVDRWLREASARKRGSTMMHYWSNYNCTIKPLLNIKVNNLDEDRMEEFIAAAGATSKRGDGRAWARTAFNNVRAAMRWNHAKGYITSNPMAGIRFEYHAREKVRKAIPLEDYFLILDACEGRESQLIWQVLAATGARKGEITALDVQDIDFRRGVINADKQAMAETKGKVVRYGNKTEDDDDTIRIRPALMEALRVHTAGRPGNSPVFLGPQNKQRLTYGTLDRWWYRDLKAAGLERKYVIHQLRHLFATTALDNGADLKSVSRMLRHKSVVTTMNIYKDVTPTMKDAVNVLVESAMTRPVTTFLTTPPTTQPLEQAS